jgi:hypothetical protein
MDLHVRMLDEQGANGLRFVGLEIVGDDMNRSSFRLAGDDLAEKRDKRGAGVPRHRLPDYFARLRIERRKQRQRAWR